MAEVAFYHLSRPLETALPRLLERALEQGNRVAIRSSDPERLKALDEMLWTYADASFLPHGRDGDEHAASQPVLLTASDAPANGAQVMIVLEPPIPEFAGRVLYFFDTSTIAEGRATWAGLKGRDGIERTYWQQDERGKWTRTA